MNIKKTLIIVVYLLMLVSLCQAADFAPLVYYPAPLNNLVTVPEFPDVTWSMKQPDYWIDKTISPRTLMFDDAQIKLLNAKLRADKDAYLADFDKYPTQISGSKLQALVKRMSIPSELKYVEGKRVSYDYYKALDYNRNLDNIKNPVVIKYGFTVRQTDMRAQPTADRIYNNAANDLLDRFQETRLDPAEPVIVLHTSRDGKWYFVQSFCYAAWVKVNDIAIAANRYDWDDFRTKKFLSIKIPNFCLKNTVTGELLVWEMGAKLFLSDNQSVAVNSEPGALQREYYVVVLPARDKNGALYFERVLLDKTTEGIREGFLPCSYQNILYQAFKMYGMKFGWGGLYDSVDCSSFAQNVYRSFGIYIPRNSGQQSRMPVTTKEFYGIGGQRYEELSEVKPGSILYMPGHVMIYLGEDKGKHYIIHAFSSFGVLDKKRGIEENPVYAVAVTSMNIYRMSGRTFQDAINVGKTIQ